jgi:phospholipase D1/2
MSISVAERLQFKRRRFGSFAPVRPHTQCMAKPLIDGEETFAAIHDAIDAATETVFIAGWWVSPELYLKRPPDQHPGSRLDRLLQRKAEAGVKIFVLVYKEALGDLILPLNSAHTKRSLRALHGHNIHVMRDPEFLVESFGYWSHHEKIVCIDQRVAFIGGLDLAFGRFDITGEHTLSDDPIGAPPHPPPPPPPADGGGGAAAGAGNGDNGSDSDTEQWESIDAPTISDGAIWPGIDYANPRIRDFSEVSRCERDILHRSTEWRMPVRDMTNSNHSFTHSLTQQQNTQTHTHTHTHIHVVA